MSFHPRARRLPRLSLLPLFLSLSLSGCHPGPGNLPLDQGKAHEALTTFLDAWKAGKKVEELKPGIIGRDYAWDAGDKLASFEVVSGEKNDGQNLHIPVELKLVNAKGKESKSKVVYVVGTSPVVTVIRE